MTLPGGPAGDGAVFPDRLSRLSEAMLQINESLDFDSVLQQVVDNARALTEARYGIIITVDVSSELEILFTSGISPEDHDLLQRMPGRWELFSHFRQLPRSLRLGDIHRYASERDLPEFNLLPVEAFLAAPMRHGGESIGYIHLARDRGEPEFSQEDEETLVMFAAQAALVIANARRHREEQRARADLETLVEISPVGVLVFDARTGLLRMANGEARRIGGARGLASDRALHLLSNLSVRRPDGTEISLSALALALVMGGGKRLQGEDLVVIPNDGPRVPVLVNATPMRSEDGEAVSIVATVQDMRPVEELERSRADFLTMVNHELRTPLAAIRGSATTVLDDASALDPAEMRQFFRIVLDQADRMRGLINDLLDVARIQAGELPVAPAPVYVADLIDNAGSVFPGGSSRHNLVLDVPPGLPPVVADRMRITQVLGVLLTNAARHAPDGSDITVKARSEDYQVVVSVTAQGRGISAEQLPHLFRKFARDEAEKGNPDAPDTGLGLEVCRGIVEAHGGRIWAEYSHDLGTRFTFTLPVSDGVGVVGAGSPGASATSSPGSDTEPVRILAVDDDPQTLRYVRDALTRAGYVPVMSADPAEVHHLMAAERPQLVLLDLMLPGVDGVDLMGEILESFDVPVIFLSAYGQEDVIARAFDMGAADYLVKPFAPTELAARIRSALRRRTHPVDQERYVLNDLAVDYSERSASLAGIRVRLTPTEYRVLEQLAKHSGRALSHSELLERVWGPNAGKDARPVRTVVKNLRRKLEDDPEDPRYIFTEPRVGYRMGR